MRGVTLDNGDRIDAPIVVNVAGPYSASVNRMAGVEQAMKIRTRPMRHEVHVVPGPPAIDLDVEGFHTADGDQGIYFRPESCGSFLVGSEDPDCDERDWVADPETFDRGVTRSHWEAQVYGSPAGSPRCPCRRGWPVWSISTTSPTTGSRCTTCPICRATTWLSGPAATSSRTHRSRGT